MNFYQEALMKAFKRKSDVYWQDNEQEYKQLLELIEAEHQMFWTGVCWTKCYIYLKYGTLNQFFSYIRREIYVLDDNLVREMLDIIDAVNQMYKLLLALDENNDHFVRCR